MEKGLEKDMLKKKNVYKKKTNKQKRETNKRKLVKMKSNVKTCWKKIEHVNKIK